MLGELARSAGASCGGRWRPRGAAGRRRRRGDAVDRDALAGQRGELVEVAVDVDLVDRAHPRLAAAGRVGELVHAGVAQVAVVARDVARTRLLDLAAAGPAGGGCASSFSTTFVSLMRWKKKSQLRLLTVGAVALEAPAVVGAEEARALGADRHVAGGDRAEVVLRERVRVAVGQAREVAREDVRDPVRRAPDRHVHGMRRGRRGKPCRDHDPCQDLDPSPHRAPRYPA